MSIPVVFDTTRLVSYDVRMPKKPLTAEEITAAQRLRTVWESKKRELKLTQEEMAHRCGWETQGAFAHYLNQKNPLNIEAVIKIATVLQVSTEDIWPGLVPPPPPLPERPVSDEALRIALAIDSLRPADRAALRAVVDAFLKSKGVSLYAQAS